MRKPSKFVAREEFDRMKRLADLHILALNYVYRGKPDTTERVKWDGDTYILELFGRDGANGGALVQTFRHRGQPDSIDVFHFEDFLRDWRSRLGDSPYTVLFASAAERMARWEAPAW